MIAPSHRLIFAAAVLLVPAGLLVALTPALLTPLLALLLVAVVVAVADAVRGIGALRGLEAALPPLLRLSQDRPGAVTIRVRNPAQRPTLLRLALALPAEVTMPEPELELRLPAGAEWVQHDWPCVGTRRGRCVIARCHFEQASPLGLWAVRGAGGGPTEVRIYPNLLHERRGLAALFLRQSNMGMHLQRQVGKGREFEQLREYLPGDSYEDIHWKAAAKRGRPVTKMYQIERTQEIYVMVDASRLSARPADPNDPAGDTHLDRFVTAALVLGLAAERQGDNVGLLTFADRVETFVRARGGKAHYGVCRDALYTLTPRLVSPDYDAVCTFIRQHITRRGLLIFLTNLDDPVLREEFARNVPLIARRHLILVDAIAQPGVRPIFSDPDVATVEDLYADLAGHLRWQDLRELERILKRQGVDFAVLPADALCADVVSQYMNVKRRQAL